MRNFRSERETRAKLLKPKLSSPKKKVEARKNPKYQSVSEPKIRNSNMNTDLLLLHLPILTVFPSSSDSILPRNKLEQKKTFKIQSKQVSALMKKKQPRLWTSWVWKLLFCNVQGQCHCDSPAIQVLDNPHYLQGCRQCCLCHPHVLFILKVILRYSKKPRSKSSLAEIFNIIPIFLSVSIWLCGMRERPPLAQLCWVFKSKAFREVRNNKTEEL